MSTKQPKFFHIIINGYFRILCILSVDLVITFINSKILGLASIHHRMLVTMIGMGVVLLLFSFLFSVIDRLTKLVLKVTVEVGNLLVFRKTAILLILTSMLVGIFCSYHYVWFGGWPQYETFPVEEYLKYFN